MTNPVPGAAAGMPDLVDCARVYATEAHQRINHRRKYNDEPYHVHLSAVAKLVASVTDDPEMIAAAWLHDTVERLRKAREFRQERLRRKIAATSVAGTRVCSAG